jgi:2-haloacid dehalogenase
MLGAYFPRRLALIVMTQPPAPRWLTFDCYGTLIDWENGVRRSFREIARVPADLENELFQAWEQEQWKKIQGSYEPYTQIMKSSFREVLEQFGFLCTTSSEDAFVTSLARWEPFPEVNSALTKLAQRYKLAIISNTDRELLGWTLRHFHNRFDALITAEDVKQYKPNPEVFRFALSRLNCAPQDVVHVAFGAEYDFRPAAAVGLRVAYLNRKQLPRPDIFFEAEITSLDELAGFWGAPDVKAPAQNRRPSLHG